MSEQNGPPPSVLIVDDNPLIVNVLQSLLQAEEYLVSVSSNGAEALSVLGKTAVDVIVCDVMMPTMDGYEFHEKVRSNPDLSHIPFIFLSALSEDSEINRGRETGADDYLCKPFDPRSLMAVIKGKVKRSRVLKAQAEERYNAYRKKVVHTLSHEFRTPLVAINTGSELLLDQAGTLDPKKAQNLLEAIRRGGQRLEKLVNDFMLMQQIEAGIAQRLVETRAQAVSLDKIVHKYVQQNVDDLVKDGFIIKVHSDKDAHSSRVYEPYISDIISRLVNNAVKFKKDDLHIDIHLIHQGDVNYIEVHDRGIGMDPAHAREAMDAFAQIDREKLEQQGSGVGLAIASRYARIHGGILDYRPNESGGSIVILSLPAAAP